MTSVVCDASVLFKVLVSEPESEIADRLIESHQIAVPELVYAEIGNAIWAHGRRSALSPEAAAAAAKFEVFHGLPLEVHVIRPYPRRALALALALAHPIYDCVYLVLAEDLKRPLVTADKRFRSVVRRETAAEVRMLSEFA